MVIIPFYIEGNVTLQGEEMTMGRHYHVYGECQLIVKNESKLGAWAYKLVIN
jgi:hypothetical protein